MTQRQISTAPFLESEKNTPAIMLEVLLVALVVLCAATYYFGLCALLVTGASTLGAVICEWFFTRKKSRLGSILDYSALLTGLLLGLTLPPGLPLWMAFLGGGVSIALGKLIWGGLGENVFNPALVGRAFLQASFPAAMTTWSPSGEAFINSSLSRNFATPFMIPTSDAVTSATPLGLIKFQDKLTALSHLAFGNTGGSLGETSAILLILCGLWLAARKIFDWRLCASTILSVFVLSGIIHLFNPSTPTPLFMVLSGGLLFGAVFMVTDPVTTPITPKGAWLFGLGTGALVVIIRLFGGSPEAVMFSILLMNSVTPHINRLTQPRTFGEVKS